ncbi:MAG: 50S ribosomal protein L22 [Patescibacteria group bacterium]
MTEVIAKTRFAQSAPRKLRAVAKLVKSKPAFPSLTTLQFTPKKAAKVLAKTLKTAIYNAVNNFNYDKKDLIIKNILIDQGPTLVRFIAMARGSGNSYKKRTSHITVILEVVEPVSITKTPAKKADSPAKTVTKKTSSKSKATKKDTAKAKGAKTTVSVRSRRTPKPKK